MDLEQLAWLLISAAWFLLPSYGANMAPVVVARLQLLPSLAVPIDGGSYYRGHRLLGDNKTWRGIVVGVVAGLAVVWLQQTAYLRFESIRSISVFDYGVRDAWLIGFLLSFGALAGDSAKSFIKRQIGIAPGQPFRPWDQIDQTLGALLLVSVYVVPPVGVIMMALLVTFLGVYGVNLVAYYLGVKSVPW